MKLLLALMALLAVLSLPAGADDSLWSRSFAAFGLGYQNTCGTVNALGYRDGSIYVAGLFDRVGTIPASNIARYDGYQWHALDEGVDGEVYDMVILDQAIYVCGGFGSAGGDPAAGVARWHGGSWYSLGDDSPNGMIYCLEYDLGVLYAGGSFTMMGEVPTGRVAAWNGIEWSAAALNNLTFEGWNYGTVYSLEMFGGELWAGGDFDYAHPYTMPYLAYMFEDRWTAPGTGVGFDDRVERLRSGGSTLWVIGRFHTVEGEDSPLLAKAYVGHDLHPFTDSLPGGWVRDIIPYDHSFVLATDRTVRFHNIYGWSSPYDTLANVHVLDDIIGDIVAGGHFTEGIGYGDGLARWDGHGWRHVGGGLAATAEAREYVNAFTSYDGDLVAGGYFNVESMSPEFPHCYNVGRYDGRHWQPLGRGFTDQVLDLAVFQGQLHAAGQFETSGGEPTGHLARWDGTAWQPLGGGAGIDGTVNDLLIHDGLLVAGGSFNNAGGVPCDDLVTWDGSTFAVLGQGQMEGGMVTAMASHDGDLCIAGYFSALDGVPANHVARWDGFAWHALGDGLDGQVHALASYGGQLWAGRRFNVTGEAVAALSRWDGEQWHDAGAFVGSDDLTEVATLLAGSAGLVVGGAFDTVDGLTVNNAALWTGGSWESFGSGVSGGFWYTGVRALHVHDERLHLGGDFTQAGGYASVSLARWNEVMTPVFLQRFSALAQDDGLGPAVRLDWNAATGGGPAEFRLTAARAGGASWDVPCRPAGEGAWCAVDRAAALASGGEVTYLLAGRETDEAWAEVGRRTVTIERTGAWERPRLAVAPNPANPRTSIELWLPRAGEVALGVYDLRGRRVARLLDGVQAAGRLTVTWDGRDDGGREAASGVYLVQVRHAAGVTAERVALVR